MSVSVRARPCSSVWLFRRVSGGAIPPPPEPHRVMASLSAPRHIPLPPATFRPPPSPIFPFFPLFFALLAPFSPFVGSCRLSQALQRPSPMRPLRPICPIFQLSIPRHFLSIQSILSITLNSPQKPPFVSIFSQFCPFRPVFCSFFALFRPKPAPTAPAPQQPGVTASPRYGVPLGTPPHSTPSRHFPPPPFPQFPHFPLVFRPFFAKNPLKTPQKPQKTPKKP